MTKAFVLLSGGIDSTTCLFDALKNYDEVEAVSINYGQKHFKETEFANATCKAQGVEHRILDIRGLLDGNGVMLTDAETSIPSIDYSDIEGVSPTYVPFRNGTLLSIIAAQAQKWVMAEIDRRKDDMNAHDYAGKHFTDQELLDMMRDSSAVYLGAHAEDAHNWAYPDCTPEFNGAMANAIYTGTYYTVRLRTPLLNMTKQEVIEYGYSMGVDWKSTWSCYAGGEKHCGECPTCRARKQAFIAAEIPDPTEYAV